MLTDSTTRYGWISILLHWIGAALILYLFIDGQRAEHALWSSGVREWHIAAGAAASLVLLPRVLWRLMQAIPAPLSEGRLLNGVAAVVKLALLIDIVLSLLTGWLAVWLNGQPVTLLGVPLASPFAGSHDMHEAMAGVHSLLVHLFIPIVALHVLGALKHLVWDRDRTIVRMLWARGDA